MGQDRVFQRLNHVAHGAHASELQHQRVPRVKVLDSLHRGAGSLWQLGRGRWQCCGSIRPSRRGVASTSCASRARVRGFGWPCRPAVACDAHAEGEVAAQHRFLGGSVRRVQLGGRLPRWVQRRGGASKRPCKTLCTNTQADGAVSHRWYNDRAGYQRTSNNMRVLAADTLLLITGISARR